MTEKTARHAYDQVALEFGISVEMVRAICGPIGRQTEIDYYERLNLLRGKLEVHGMLPRKFNPQCQENKVDEPTEPHELIACALCSNFLEEDDEGEPVVHSETSERGLICRHCVAARI